MRARADSVNGLKFGLLYGLLIAGASFFVHREVWRHLDMWPLIFDSWSENFLCAAAVVHGYLIGAFNRTQIDLQLKTAYRWAMTWGIPVFMFFYIAAAALCERLVFGVWDSAILRGVGVAIVCASIGLRVWAHATIPKFLCANTAFTKEPEALVAVSPEEKPAIGATEDTAQISEKMADPAPAEIAPDPEPVAREAAPADLLPTKESPVMVYSEMRGPFKWIRHPDRAGRVLFLVGAPLCFGAWMPLAAIPGAVVLINWHLNDLEAFCVSQLGEPYLLYKSRTKRLIPGIF